MKKVISLLLMVTLCVSLMACGTGKNVNDTAEREANNKEEIQTTETESQTAEGTEDTETSTKAETEVSTRAEVSAETGTSTDAEIKAGSNILVVYFSATGNTKAIAESIADGLQADIYEIVPEEPYTDADLNYNDNNSRSTLEMNDSAARPVISEAVENFKQYDTVFLGA